VKRSWGFHAGLMAAVCCILGVAFFPAWRELVNLWFQTESYAHGPMVPAICAWLIWRLRTSINTQLQPSTWWLGALGIIACALVWLIGDVLQISALRHFALMGTLICAAAACFGRAVFTALFFPITFLLFAVPFGEFLIEPMMDQTADAVVVALQWTGIPVYQEARRLVIPSGSWAVVEACAGTRYLIASVMLGALFAYLFFRSWKRRVAFMIAAIAVPVIANWIRAYLIVMIGHLSNNKYGLGADHVMFGWVFFGAFIFAMFSIGARWREDHDDAPQFSVKTAQKTLEPGRSLRARIAAPIAAAVVSACVPFAAAKMTMGADVIALAPLVSAADWRNEPGQDWQPDFSGERGKVAGSFRSNSGSVVAFSRSAFSGQRGSNRMLRFGNYFFTESDTAAASIRTTHYSKIINGQNVSLVEYRLPDRYGVRLIRGTYQIATQRLSSPYSAKLALAMQTLRGAGDRSDVIAWSTLARDDAQAKATLDQFEASFGDQLLRPAP
jgi:exosortase A